MAGEEVHVNVLSYTPLVRAHAAQRSTESKRCDSASPTGASPWLTVTDAARRLGYPVKAGRAPNSVYGIAHEIGHRVNGRLLIHVDELDGYVRRHNSGD